MSAVGPKKGAAEGSKEGPVSVLVLGCCCMGLGIGVGRRTLRGDEAEDAGAYDECCAHHDGCLRDDWVIKESGRYMCVVCGI
jgi:hypothetical protein